MHSYDYSLLGKPRHVHTIDGEFRASSTIGSANSVALAARGIVASRFHMFSIYTYNGGNGVAAFAVCEIITQLGLF